jgi:transposase InsO family protein
MNATDNFKLIQTHPEIEQRVKILTFFQKHGLAATKDAYGISRATIYLWQHKLKQSGGKLASLRNLSRRPHNTRRMYVEPKILDFIEGSRKQYPRLSKDKLKPLLDEFCRDNSLTPVSVSKIGKIISRHRFFFYLKPRKKPGSSKAKPRVFGYEVKEIGDLTQLDAITKFKDGLKRYVITSIDVTGKFGFAFGYSSLSSIKGADYLTKLNQVAPFAIKAIQTDNGSEFAKSADKAMLDQGIVHFYTYPKSPKMNAYIERFNRTLQEEFLDYHEDLLFSDIKVFNNQLMDYLLFYNTKRIHQSLNNQTPIDYLIKKSNMYGTGTNT